MAIHLTESKLRQIIREEAAKLTRRPTRRLRESAGDTSQYDEMAKEYGLTHYIDYDLDISPGELGGAGVGENVAEYVVDLIPEFDGVLSPSEDIVVMINPSGPGGGIPVFRFYGDNTTMSMLAGALGEMEGDAPRTDLIKRIGARSSSMTMPPPTPGLAIGQVDPATGVVYKGPRLGSKGGSDTLAAAQAMAPTMLSAIPKRSIEYARKTGKTDRLFTQIMRHPQFIELAKQNGSAPSNHLADAIMDILFKSR